MTIIVTRQLVNLISIIAQIPAYETGCGDLWVDPHEVPLGVDWLACVRALATGDAITSGDLTYRAR